ncbi:hypothetical protein U9M48_030338 [Paspalum notatum var. saurae]|uniref:Uncharacterized protein n=1 Tax=Paspalum notatum var. saurae TaxID=547442 RepID=A0AAQ3U4Q1_PASNO
MRVVNHTYGVKDQDRKVDSDRNGEIADFPRGHLTISNSGIEEGAPPGARAEFLWRRLQPHLPPKKKNLKTAASISAAPPPSSPAGSHRLAPPQARPSSSTDSNVTVDPAEIQYQFVNSRSTAD